MILKQQLQQQMVASDSNKTIQLMKIVDPFTAIQVKTCSKQKQTITLNRFKILPCNLKQTKQIENDILS